MCGITGFFSEATINLVVIQSMANVIRHRGPDDAGFLIAGDYENNCRLSKAKYIDSSINFALAHRRLAIQDLSESGHQPMSYKNRYWIVFNGEIYNFIELKKELQKINYSFVSHTDTEVIMATYDYWGKNCVTHFNGMWAFVLYDIQEHKVFISRDRFGIKPLYYYQDNKNFVFGSEIKALLEHPVVKRNTAPNIAQCKDYLNSGTKEYIKETTFKNIYRFDFACSYEISLENILKRPIQEKKYWSLIPNLSDEPYDEIRAVGYTQEYFDLLSDAVHLRLRADVKVGSALSGGLDSSSIVYLVNQLLRNQGKIEQQETFSTVYKSIGTQHCDESTFINNLAETLQVKSNQIEPKTEDIPIEHRKMIWVMDTPPNNTLMSSWYTFKHVASTDIRVTLDGQGADEQLAGYLTYITFHFANCVFSNLLKEYKNFSCIPNTKTKIIQGIALNLSTKVLTKKLTKAITLFLTQKIYHRRIDPFIPLNEKLSEDISTSLVNLLHYADRTSMAFSIESRMPFMDYRIVTLLASIPASMKLYNGWTKYIARKAFDKKISENITWRKDKMGWPIPEEYWFRGIHKEWLLKTIEESLFLREQLGVIVPNVCLEAKSMTYLIRLLNLAVWYETFFETKYNDN